MKIKDLKINEAGMMDRMKVGASNFLQGLGVISDKDHSTLIKGPVINKMGENMANSFIIRVRKYIEKLRKNPEHTTNDVYRLAENNVLEILKNQVRHILRINPDITSVSQMLNFIAQGSLELVLRHPDQIKRNPKLIKAFIKLVKMAIDVTPSERLPRTSNKKVEFEDVNEDLINSENLHSKEVYESLFEIYIEYIIKHFGNIGILELTENDEDVIIGLKIGSDVDDNIRNKIIRSLHDNYLEMKPRDDMVEIPVTGGTLSLVKYETDEYTMYGLKFDKSSK